MSIVGIMHKTSGRDIRRQLLPGFLLALLLTLTILVWLVVGSFFFGYHLLISHGSSMEPTLRDGDLIWAKQLDIADVKVGDIVTLPPTGQESVTHRVTRVQSLPHKGYFLETRGDASQFAEGWEIGAGGTVAVLLARVHFVGYVLEFFRSIFGIVLLIGFLATLVAMLVRRGIGCQNRSRVRCKRVRGVTTQ